MGLIAGIVALCGGLVVAPIVGISVGLWRKKKNPEASFWLTFLLVTVIAIPLSVVGIFVGLFALVALAAH